MIALHCIALHCVVLCSVVLIRCVLCCVTCTDRCSFNARGDIIVNGLLTVNQRGSSRAEIGKGLRRVSRKVC